MNLDYKNIKYEKFFKTKKSFNNKIELSNKKDNYNISEKNNAKFLKWVSNSCRYDTFFSYIVWLLNIIKKFKLQINNPNLEFLNKIYSKLIKGNII